MSEPNTEHSARGETAPRFRFAAIAASLALILGAFAWAGCGGDSSGGSEAQQGESIATSEAAQGESIGKSDAQQGESIGNSYEKKYAP
jgi:hypothetical protein